MVKANRSFVSSRTPPVDWIFRVRGRNRDGKTVTLGKYNTEEAAKAHYDSLVEEGRYQAVQVERLRPTPAESGTDSEHSQM